ncbi:hypothetical protein FAM09_24855 [Niastella caeni]|uniref:Uncharacterized protein n=1 Tax=Niastella caeni TaxID=2569763 RepID=A0A4S8HMU0_9BACT|nr:DUF6712 family protein [Niastella caeni]THU34252.1 hypothetical protein FAM09_24855 [Niastella caeni]
MALIKTIAEIRAVIPRLSRLSDTANLPNVDKAGRMHIMPLLGNGQYSALNTKYNSATPLTADEQELLKNIQLPLSAFALLDDLAFMHTIITDSGIRTAGSDKMEAAHRWEFRELQNALMSYATDGIELLLGYLFETKDKWAQWTESNEFKELDSFLIKTGTDFKRYYPLFQPLRTYWTLRPIMQEVEENYLAPALGRDLLAWVKTQDEIIITADGGEVDVKKILKRSLAQFTIKHAGETMAVQFDENGFTTLAFRGSLDSPTSDGRVAASANDLVGKLDAANREGQNNLSRSTTYLVNIANGMYNVDFGDDFANAFDSSPLKTDPNKEPYTNGNERRKIFRFR